MSDGYGQKYYKCEYLNRWIDVCFNVCIKRLNRYRIKSGRTFYFQIPCGRIRGQKLVIQYSVGGRTSRQRGVELDAAEAVEGGLEVELAAARRVDRLARPRQRVALRVVARWR